ncbi:hypothetical protein NP233_g9062 [Leucocoprinus birnbaumii]|uniref:F-box domain-containing protein n=1 Tax=Leucocoprinus birnbaumii TaxID=56174 RepID=A0AAD5VPL4_9AGAR|nr:hypothetical protein NP233_g9062 [Leucocoprinus birnbaumii]
MLWSNRLTSIELGLDDIIPFKDIDERKSDERRQLDEVIKEIQAEVVELFRQRNELTPIFALPPEIFAQIFVLVRDLSPFKKQYYSKKPTLPWLGITQVCHYWREIAHGHPPLWTILNFDDVNLTKFLLERTKNGPLVVKHTFTRFDSNLAEGIELAMTHLPRIQLLDISCTAGRPQNFQTTFLDPLISTTQFLQEVCLSFQPDDYSAFMKSRPVVLPRRAFEGSVSLRCLALNNVRVDWDYFLKSHTNITQLWLENSNVPTTTQLFAVLVRLPRLQSLRLIKTLPPAKVTPCTQAVRLDFLEELTINGGIDSCKQFLARVLYPHHSRITVCHTPAPELPQLEGCLVILSTLAKRLKNFPIRTIALVSTHALTFEIRAYEEGPCITNQDTNFTHLKTAPRLSLSSFSYRLFSSHIFPAFLDVFNVTELRSLVLPDTSAMLIRAENIHSSCSRLPNLEIVTAGRCFSPVCEAITTGLPKLLSQAQTRVVSPNGRVIPSDNLAGKSDDVGFRSLKILMVENAEFGCRYDNWDCLLLCAKVRHDAGVPLERIVLAGSRRLRKTRIRKLENLITGSVEINDQKGTKFDPDSDCDGNSTEYSEDEYEPFQ